MKCGDDMLRFIAKGLEMSPNDRPRVKALMDELTQELRLRRRRLAPDEWRRFVARCRAHDLCGLVHQDPFTRWSFQKPHGCPGGASLLGFILGEPEAADTVNSSSMLGQSIYARNRNSSSCRAIRYRKSLLTNKLFPLEKRPVLSAACGHFREKREPGPGKRQSTAYASNEQGQGENGRSIESEHAVINRDSADKVDAGTSSERRFDFVHTAGFYEHLALPLAQRLTQLLFEKLHIGGTLLISNFTHDTEDVGYLEAYMDWWLTYRNELEMLEIAGTLPRSEVGAIRTFRDPERQIVFMEMVRSNRCVNSTTSGRETMDCLSAIVYRKTRLLVRE